MSMKECVYGVVAQIKGDVRLAASNIKHNIHSMCFILVQAPFSFSGENSFQSKGLSHSKIKFWKCIFAKA